MKVIGVTGGKGGTGKSTVATALAVELAKNSKVLLVDMDVDCPNDHLIISIKRKYLKTVYQRIPNWDFDKCTKCGLCADVCVTKAVVMLQDKYPVFIPAQCNGCGSCVAKCPTDAISWTEKEIGKIYSGHGHGIDFLSGELKISEPVSEFVVDGLKEIIEKRKEKYDYVVIDTAAGTHCDVVVALETCDFVLAVTEPTPLGEHDAELIIKLAIKLKKPFEVILNRYENSDIMIKNMLKKYNKKIYVRIPYKKEIMEASSKGIPVEDDSIKQIVKGIENGLK